MGLLEQAKAEHDEKQAAQRAEGQERERGEAKREAEKLTGEWEHPVVWKRTSEVTLPGASDGRWYPVKAHLREFLVADEIRIARGNPPRSASSSYKTNWLIAPCSVCTADAYVELGHQSKFIEQLGDAAARTPLCTDCKLLQEDARCSHCGQPYYTGGEQ